MKSNGGSNIHSIYSSTSNSVSINNNVSAINRANLSFQERMNLKPTAPIPVYINVYDLTPHNSYIYPVGFGAFHSGIEVYGLEVSFGGHEFDSTGVFEVMPRCASGATYRETVHIGYCNLSQQEVRNIIDELAAKYPGSTYHALNRNCNHFTDEFCYRICNKGIPNWINRLAYYASLVECLLPQTLYLISAPSGSNNASTNNSDRSATQRLL